MQKAHGAPRNQIKGHNMAATTKTVKKRRFSFAAVSKFFKEVVAELKRVSWPNKKELWTYTLAVLVFVLLMSAVIGGLDFLFAEGMKLITG